jgi:hypothetical protein
MDTWSLNEKYSLEVKKINDEISLLKTNFTKLYEHVNNIVSEIKNKEQDNAKPKKVRTKISKGK